jgi:hypothetical protein
VKNIGTLPPENPGTVRRSMRHRTRMQPVRWFIRLFLVTQTSARIVRDGGSRAKLKNTIQLPANEAMAIIWFGAPHKRQPAITAMTNLWQQCGRVIAGGDWTWLNTVSWARQCFCILLLHNLFRD